MLCGNREGRHLDSVNRKVTAESISLPLLQSHTDPRLPFGAAAGVGGAQGPLQGGQVDADGRNGPAAPFAAGAGAGRGLDGLGARGGLGGVQIDVL